MSFSLQVTHGDLRFGTNGLSTVTGGAKLTQDLRCALLESQGHDPLHPSYGSVLDGGIDPSTGKRSEGVIGQIDNAQASAFIQAEIQRICRIYQGSQIARNQTDVATYGKSTLTADEALLSVSKINLQQALDQVLVTAVLQTGTGGLPLAVPFSVAS